MRVKIWLYKAIYMWIRCLLDDNYFIIIKDKNSKSNWCTYSWEDDVDGLNKIYKNHLREQINSLSKNTNRTCEEKCIGFQA